MGMFDMGGGGLGQGKWEGRWEVIWGDVGFLAKFGVSANFDKT